MCNKFKERIKNDTIIMHFMNIFFLLNKPLITKETIIEGTKVKMHNIFIAYPIAYSAVQIALGRHGARQDFSLSKRKVKIKPTR